MKTIQERNEKIKGFISRNYQASLSRLGQNKTDITHSNILAAQ